MANFIVTTLNDELDAADTVAATANPNDLSLREALALTQENGAGVADVITFHPSLAPGTLTPPTRGDWRRYSSSLPAPCSPRIVITFVFAAAVAQRVITMSSVALDPPMMPVMSTAKAE